MTAVTKAQEARFRFSTFRFDPTFLVWSVVAVLLLVLIAGPVFYLVQQSLFIPNNPNAIVVTGHYGVGNFVKAYTDPEYRSPIFLTLIVSVSVAVISLIIASVMAWAVARTDVPFPRVIRTACLASFVTPPFLGANAWVLLGGPDAGWINKWYRWLTGASGTAHIINIFTIPGLVFAIVLYVIPLAFIVVLAGLNNVSSDLEDASNIAGAGTLRTMTGITLPLVLPALFAGLILSFLEAMILFGTPAILAIPAGHEVMTTQIRAFMQSDEYRVGLAAAYALPMLLVAAGLIWLRRGVLGRKSYATIGGKGGQRRPQKLGPYRWLLFLFCAVPLVCSLALPYFALAASSLMKVQGGSLTWSNLTLEHYRFVYEKASVWQAIGNTILLAVMAATAGTAIAGLVSYITQRRLVRAYRVLGFCATIPIAIPGIVLAVGLFAAYSHPPLMLYGTLWILFIAYLTKYLPIAYQTSNAALTSIHPELEESARILGAGRLRVFGEITVPLFKAGLLASWMLMFMPSIRELSSSILLYTTRTQVLSVVILNFYEDGNIGLASTLGMVLIVITVFVVVVAYRFLGRDFMGGGEVRNV